MIGMAVHTAIGHKADKVQCCSLVFGTFQRTNDRRIISKRTISNGITNLDEILAKHRACTNRQVTNFGVSHLPLRQPDCST